MAYFKKRMYSRASELFAEAASLYPEEAEFHAYLGLSQFLSEPEPKAGAKKALYALDKAISLNPKLDKSYLFLGNIHKAIGRQDLAVHDFEKAVQCNPDNTEALYELKLLNTPRTVL